MKWLFLLCFALPAFGYSQKVSVREIKRRPLAPYYNTTDSTIIYPVFVTGNRKVDSAINQRVRSILEADQPGMSLSKVIQMTIGDGLTDLSYELTFSNRSFLSVRFYIGWAGAYPSFSYKYMNFDLRTGAELVVNDLFDADQLERIKSLVFGAKKKFLNDYKAEWLGTLRVGEVDSDSYQWSMGIVDSECINEVSVDYFTLSKSGVEFIDPCDFPHVIHAMEPLYSLKYTYPELAAFLKPEFRKRVFGL
jgi:hypothetical protein